MTGGEEESLDPTGLPTDGRTTARIRTLALRSLVVALPLLLVLLLAGPSLTESLDWKWAEFVSTRSVTCTWVSPQDGTVWVGTTGGVLRRDRAGTWRRFTRRDGLPDVEVRRLEGDESGLVAILARGAARWTGREWTSCSAPPPRPPGEGSGGLGLPPGAEELVGEAVWKGRRHAVTRRGDLWREHGGHWQGMELPPGRGSHATGLAVTDGGLVVAMYGGGLWAWDGSAWCAVETPEAARGATCLAGRGGTLWVGTRDEGVWNLTAGRWEQHLEAGEPFSHNCQALAEFRGDIYVATLDAGLVVWHSGAFQHVVCGAAGLSSDCPREMAVFQDRLFVRHGSGEVDCYDGSTWERDVLRKVLPRRGASALTVADGRLMVGQWGGFSTFDGRAWNHTLKTTDLQGQPITSLLPDGERVWVGTQRHGLALVEVRAGTAEWHDERAGMPDDWITTLASTGGTVWAGTFVGGVTCRQDGRWHVPPALRGRQVTALLALSSDEALVGTRFGLWRWTHGDVIPISGRIPPMDPEVQALLRASDGSTWIGTRTGLWRAR